MRQELMDLKTSILDKVDLYWWRERAFSLGFETGKNCGFRLVGKGERDRSNWYIL